MYTNINLPVPENEYRQLRGSIPEKEEKRLKEKYGRHFIASPVELWVFDRMVDVYGEELHDFDSAEWTSDGIVEADDVDRDGSGRFR